MFSNLITKRWKVNFNSSFILILTQCKGFTLRGHSGRTLNVCHWRRGENWGSWVRQLLSNSVQASPTWSPRSGAAVLPCCLHSKQVNQIISCCLCAQSLSHVWLFCDPINYSPPESSVHGKNTEVGCHFLLQGIFPIQGSNPCLLYLLHWQADSLPLSHLASPLSHV